MNLPDFLPSAAFVLFSVTAMSVAHARGGWDGNGLSVSGMAQDTQAARIAPGAGKTATGGQVRYVELPVTTVRSDRPLTR